MKIGIFDSGFGGLTILKKIHELLPEYEYLYLGDNARTPYGDRSPDTIFGYTRQGVEYLFNEQCSIVILACNTASALALRTLQQCWLLTHFPNRRILGIIIPVIEHLKESAAKEPIAVVGTRATIQSDVYGKELRKAYGEKILFFSHPCPLLVPLIEEGWHQTVPARMILKKYLRPLKLKRIATLILGCTHYPIVRREIERIMGRNVKIIEPGEHVARAFKIYLKRHPEYETRLSRKGTITCMTTDTNNAFERYAARLWGVVLTCKKISLG